MILDPAATLHTHDPTPAAFGSCDPAVPFTRNNVAWRNKLDIVTAPPGAANLLRFRAPHLVVIVHSPDQGMGDFMQDSVRDLFLRCLLRKGVRQGDDPRRVLTTPRAFPAII